MVGRFRGMARGCSALSFVGSGKVSEMRGWLKQGFAGIVADAGILLTVRGHGRGRNGVLTHADIVLVGGVLDVCKLGSMIAHVDSGSIVGIVIRFRVGFVIHLIVRVVAVFAVGCLLYTSPSPRDA